MMVAYSFQKRFAPYIREGRKLQTIRADRVRHARVGEMLQLFTGMRTAHCMKICDDVRCTQVVTVGIRFSAQGEIEQVTVGGEPIVDLDAFADLDGFSDAADMSAFWKLKHDGIGQGISTLFTGVLIKWAAPRFDLVARHAATNIGE